MKADLIPNFPHLCRACRLRDPLVTEVGFRTFIETWQPQLKPELYIHHGVAVIFFALIDGTGDQNTPAPTLYDRIISLGNRERNPAAVNCASFEDLKHAVGRAIEKLAILNKRPCPETTISNKCWIKIEPLLELKRNNVEFAIPEGGKSIDIFAVAEAARVQVEKLYGKAQCQGDVHSKNVLVRLDREPLFIDFANSGPGHPAFDLVRLEASLLYTHFRMSEGEDKMVECFYQTFTTGQTFENIKASHPSLLSSQPSCIAVFTSLETRRLALEVLRTYGGDEKDYFAMKMVVACQSLIIPGFQEGAVRASIRALSKILAELKI